MGCNARKTKNNISYKYFIKNIPPYCVYFRPKDAGSISDYVTSKDRMAVK
jgi:hypothetical protein